MHIWEMFTYDVIIRFQGNLEDITLLCLNQEEEHVLWRERERERVNRWSAARICLYIM